MNQPDPASYFHRMLRGEAAPAPVLTLLGSQVEHVDVGAGTLRATYEAQPGFRNPAGTVQGGMLSAMLDDLTASLVDATLPAGQGVATLSLNVSFLRPAQVGQLSGEACLLKRGREVCHVVGTLRQGGQEVAAAIAVCKIVEAAPSGA